MANGRSPRELIRGMTRVGTFGPEIRAAELRGPALLGPTASAPVAIGALAVGAVAIGALAIRRLAVGRADVKTLRIEDLEVGRLRVERLDVAGGEAPGGGMPVPPSKLAHVDLVVSSIERSLPFYLGLLGPLGWEMHGEVEGEHGQTIHYLGIKEPNGMSDLGLREAISDAHPVPYDRRAVGIEHVCFDAPSREVVDERARWAREGGAEIISGPREYDYTPGYYAVFIADPDGIKLELVHRPDFWEDARG
jgi:catechol 2,3-dioxygenase-like lactoylglutathione lyase family enzyme